MNILCICMIVQQFAFQRTLTTVNLANRIAIGHTAQTSTLHENYRQNVNSLRNGLIFTFQNCN